MYHSSINLQDPFCQLIPLRPLWTSPQWYPHLSSSPHSWCCPVGVASISPPRIWQFKCHMRLAQKFGTLSKKKDVGQESLFFAICPHVWVLTHSHHRLETFARTFFPPSVLDVLFGQLDLAPRIFCLSDGHLHHDFLERSRDERINGVEGVPTLLSGMSFMWIHGKAWPNGTIP